MSNFTFKPHNDSTKESLSPIVSFTYDDSAIGGISYRTDVFWSGIHHRKCEERFSHPDPVVSRLFIFQKGSAELMIDGNKQRLLPMRIYLLPQGQSFKIKYSTGSTLFYWHLSITKLNLVPLFFGLTGVKTVRGQHKLIKELLETRRSLNRIFCHVHLFHLLIKIVSQVKSEIKKIDEQQLPFLEVLSFIHGHSREKISISELEKKFSTGGYVLSKKFRKQFGIPLKKYLSQLKVKNAKELLLIKDLSIERVADFLDFGHVSYFYRFFKRSTQMTPDEYRKAHQT